MKKKREGNGKGENERPSKLQRKSKESISERENKGLRTDWISGGRR